MLVASKMCYVFAALVEAGRKGDLKINPDHGISPEKFKDERLDLRNSNGEHGLSLAQIRGIITDNKEVVHNLVDDWNGTFVRSLLPIIAAAEAENPESDGIFLETFNCLNQETQCVYGVVKNVDKKYIAIVFRGSSTPFTNSDWHQNVKATLTGIVTPAKVKDRMEGSLKDKLDVHEGFYEYLFDDKLGPDDKQKFDWILEDIKGFVDDGYKIFVSGHSLGAALASLAAFKLAGSGKEWIPKPITCISFASPYVGTTGYHQAFTELEKMNLIRYLRVTNTDDVVTTIPSFSMGWPWNMHAYKHVGINLDLADDSFAFQEGPSGFAYSMFKSWLGVTALEHHRLRLYESRMKSHSDTLKDMKIDDLYKNEKYVGKNFLDTENSNAV